SAPDETGLRRAAEHAAAAADEQLLQQVWRLFHARRRTSGDRRGTRVLAADLLGMDSAAPAVQALVAATPLLARRRTRWIALAGAAAVALFSLFAATRGAPVPVTADFVVWTVDSITGEGKLVGVRIDPNAPWDAGAPLEAVEMDSTDVPAMPHGVVAPLHRSPNGRDWWGNGKFADMGDEGVLLGAEGATWRPFSSPGDDGIGSLSPDGHQIAAMTARYDTVTDHLQVIRLPLRGGPVRRLSNNNEYDRLASWRPDGTQIATQRHYYEQYSKDRVCIFDLDGSNERCLSIGIAGEFRVDGWLDERRLLVEIYGEGFWAMDAASGALDRIPGMVGTIINLDGDLRLCNCRVATEDAPSFYLMPAAQPTAARPILYRGRPLRGKVLFAANWPARGAWLDSLRIRLPVGGLSVDNVHRLTAEGRRANGAPAWLHDLRWTSRDTSVATIDSTGRLRPKRLGTSWIIVSAGGWRVDSAQVIITPPSSRTVMQESWGEGWMKRWRVFGTPAATVINTTRGPALLPNGDGSYPTGAYSPTPIAALSGVGFEAELSLKITRTQWQTLGLDMRDPAMLTAIRIWDHRTGDSPDLGRPYCALGVPGDEGVVGLDYMSISGRVAGNVRVAASPNLYNGSWHRFRLQLLPDGRCALAIDGQPVGILQSNLSQMPRAVVPLIAGHDRFGGQLVVGKFEAWSGVRGGVDWTALDADTSVRRP
ncbi:MAG: hypothetical protein P3B98_06495, partial [Gemmatimonadota bacterium]|nr:hypothetical protein [Gemmatimonadota bacterium]